MQKFLRRSRTTLRAVRTSLSAWLAGRFIRIAELLLGRYSERFAYVGRELIKRDRPHLAREFVATSLLLDPGNAAGAAAFRELISADAGQQTPVPDKEFGTLDAFCCFVGYARSGHSLLGALLDAHPNTAISHELNAVKFAGYGYTREDLFRQIVENTRLFAREDRQWKKYNYHVPGQWQGRFENLKIIGDKKGGGTTVALARNPAVLDELADFVRLPLRVIHFHRNPYDNIATMTNTVKAFRRKTVDNLIELYFRRAAEIEKLKQRGINGELIEISLDQLTKSPHKTLAGACEFLGLEADSGYLDNCASIVLESARKTRNNLQWSDSQLRIVQDRASGFDWLRGYDFEH